MVFYRIIRRVPGGDAAKVAVGTSLLLGIAMIPPMYKRSKKGHEFFSAEKPEEVEQSMSDKEKAKYADIVNRNVEGAKSS